MLRCVLLRCLLSKCLTTKLIRDHVVDIMSMMKNGAADVSLGVECLTSKTGKQFEHLVTTMPCNWSLQQFCNAPSNHEESELCECVALHTTFPQL
jgi:hypothetical protein